MITDNGFLVYAYPTTTRIPSVEKRVFYESDAISLAEGLKKSRRYDRIGVVRLESLALWEWNDSWISPIVRKVGS